MNDWIKFFQALVSAGLSPYQAERTVRHIVAGWPEGALACYSPNTARFLKQGRFSTLFVVRADWAKLPGPGDDYSKAYAALLVEAARQLD